MILSKILELVFYKHTSTVKITTFFYVRKTNYLEV